MTLLTVGMKLTNPAGVCIAEILDELPGDIWGLRLPAFPELNQPGGYMRSPGAMIRNAITAGDINILNP